MIIGLTIHTRKVEDDNMATGHESCKEESGSTKDKRAECKRLGIDGTIQMTVEEEGETVIDY